MFSKKSRRCAVLLSFAFLPAFSSASAGDSEETPDKEHCQSAFVVEGEARKIAARPLRAKIVQRLTVPEARWVSWFPDRQKGLYLGTLDGSNAVRVFEPGKSPSAIYLARWSSLGIGDLLGFRAAWVESNGHPSIQIGDEQGGQLVLLEPFGRPNPSVQSLDARGPTELHSLLLKDGRWVTAYADADLNRIRIVPVGKFQNVYDIPVSEAVLWLAEHRTPQGEALLAVATPSELAVFKLSESAELIFKVRASSQNVQPRWIVDERGESVLIVATAEGRIRALYPESGALGIESEPIFPGLDSLQVIREKDDVILLASSRAAGGNTRVLKMNVGMIRVISSVPEALSDQNQLRLVPGPMERPLLAFTRNVDGQRVLAFMDAENVEIVLATVPFDRGDESVRGIHPIRLGNGRVQIAVATDRRIYVVEVH